MYKSPKLDKICEYAVVIGKTRNLKYLWSQTFFYIRDIQLIVTIN